MILILLVIMGVVSLVVGLCCHFVPLTVLAICSLLFSVLVFVAAYAEYANYKERGFKTPAEYWAYRERTKTKTK